MKKYYLGISFNLLLVANTVFSVGPDEEVMVVAKPIAEEDSCQDFNEDKKDVLGVLIDRYKDEELMKIIFYSKLLEKNNSLYLCEIDKIIDRCFRLNNKRVNVSNFIRLLKSGTFFASTAICAYGGFFAWKERSGGSSLKQQDVWFPVMGIIGLLCGLHGVAELQKIANNYDQNQLYYKAIAMKNALLEYRKR